MYDMTLFSTPLLHVFIGQLSQFNNIWLGGFSQICLSVYLGHLAGVAGLLQQLEPLQVDLGETLAPQHLPHLPLLLLVQPQPPHVLALFNH